MNQGAEFSYAVSLRRLLPQANFVGCTNLCITDAVERSTEARPGSLFAVIRGTKVDARQFLQDAISRNPAGLLVDEPIPSVAIPQCVVKDVRSSYSRICESLAGEPSHRLKTAGITGTNGKTTTSWLIRSLLEQSGHSCGVLGTVEYSDGHHTEPATLTTPDSRSLAKWLSQMVRTGTGHAAIELSSHALHQGRAAGIELEAAVITNITQDHFDYHRTFDAYLEAKAKICDMVRPGGLIALNLDDPGVQTIHAKLGQSRTCRTFGLTPAADVSAQIRDQSLAGTRFRLTLDGMSWDCATRLIGRHNLSNILGAVAVCSHFGLAPREIVAGIQEFRCVPGRLERVDGGQPFETFVDYAHTDDALQRCLNSVRALTPGRVICIFGAGGDRDRTKRPKLGRAAMTADVAIVTSDNPRSEDPHQIIQEILAGMNNSTNETIVEADRRKAIELALEIAAPGDCVLIAGKGHECEQIIGADRIPFDDRQITREILRERWQPLAQPQLRVSA